VEQLERATLAQVALLPHMEEADRKKVGTFEQVRAEFDEWLMAEPAEMNMTAEDLETATLYRLLGVGQKG
jgi:hypothetical protein